MNINLDDKLVKELDSIFENERKTQDEWDVCIEDIVEEFIARQKGTWYEDNFVEEAEEPDEVHFDLRDVGCCLQWKKWSSQAYTYSTTVW